MKRKCLMLLALLLALSLLLCGCGQYLAYWLGYGNVTMWEDIQYSRPDVPAVLEQAEKTLALAEETESFRELADSVMEYYTLFSAYSTAYALANIHYCQDMTDIYWEQEYYYCEEQLAAVQSITDRLMYALAACPFREQLESDEYFGADFFDDYEGESIWDETFTSLKEQESLLINEYYGLWQQASETQWGTEAFYSTYAQPMGQVFVELIALRQQQAEYLGYESYPQFVYEYDHLRDFTPEAANAYMEQVAKVMEPLYRQVSETESWDALYTACSEQETYQYVKRLTQELGDPFRQAFQVMEWGNLYDIGYGENKYNSSYQIWLADYVQPFIFMSPTGTAVDQLTFTHEFGHFTNSWLTYGGATGTDVLEIHSQGLEYLSLGSADPVLTRYKMADALCVYVEQSAYSLFENRAYALEGDQLTLENIQALYEQTCSQFGLDYWGCDGRDFIRVNHLYTNPGYMISYVVSNDVALQLYQLEQQKPGDGLALFKQCIFSTEDSLLRFVGTYGLEDPMAEGRLESALQVLREELA